jgi:predicted nucleic acid-binding protein
VILLDTNVISAFMVEPPEPLVVKWLNRWPVREFFTTAINVYSVWFEPVTGGQAA